MPSQRITCEPATDMAGERAKLRPKHKDTYRRVNGAYGNVEHLPLRLDRHFLRVLRHTAGNISGKAGG
jgi:hypothetical protein